MASPELLAKLAAYVPAPVVQSIYRQPKLLTEPIARRFAAAVLFTDISGFTHLSELLSQAGPTGAEELTYLINAYFTRMIETIQQYSGQVVKFSGDALTVLFPAEEEMTMTTAVRAAGECGLAMQAQMKDFNDIHTPRGKASLSMKVAIGAGEILECSVGGALGRWEYLVAGAPLVQVATAEHQAKPGQIILSPAAWQYVTPFFRGRLIAGQDGLVILEKRLRSLPPTKPIPLDWSLLTPDEQLIAEQVLQCYVPGAVKIRLNEQAEWLAELRRMTIVFVGIGGFDYEAETVLTQIQEFLQAVQELLYSFEGALNKVAVDDKGTVLLLLFGAPPFSHEDDATRAVTCALDLRQVAAEQNLRVSVGIAEGQIFAGPVGAPNRREYTVIGDHVNLAARLMQHGTADWITISERIKDRAGPHFVFEDLGEIAIKGKAHTLPAYRVKREQDAQDEFMIRHLLNEDLLINRQPELELILRVANKAQSGHFQIFFIEGELGIGKSRLATELVREWVIGGGVGYGSKCLSYGRQIPYQAWREVLTAIHGLSPHLPSEHQLDRLRRGVADLPDPPDQPNYWLKRLPLLAEAMNIEAPENKFTRDISGQLRRNNTFVMIEAILRWQAERHPLLLLLEDIQWADELSLSLIDHLTTTLTDTPVLLLLVHRPMTENPWSKLPEIRELPYTTTIQLEPLTTDQSQELLTLLLNQKIFPEAVFDTLLNRSQGNPFFLQEIARTALNALDDQTQNGNQEFFVLPDLPGTIHDVILSRVDRLPEETAKVTLKVASVIGYRFPRSLLLDIHPMEQSLFDIIAQLEKLEQEKLIRLDTPAPKWEYIFHNVVTQEVVYEGLLLAQRRQLHSAVGLALEKVTPEAVEQLAFHFGHSANFDKAIHYLNLAAQKAKREYANQAAIDYYTEILNLFNAPDPGTNKPRGILSAEYWDFLMQRAKLYNLIGDRDREIEELGTLGIIAEALNDTYRRALGAKQWAYLYGTYGNYEAGLDLIERSVQLAESLDDKKLMGEGYNYWGQLLYLRHDYERAFEYLQRALYIAQSQQDKNGQAECLNSLGRVAHYQADFEVALYFFNEAICIREELDNQVGLADSLTNLGRVYYQMGQYMEALATFRQALNLYITIGDRTGEAYARHNVGRIYRSLGKYDQAHHIFEKALTLHQAVRDSRGESASLYHLGFLHNRLGDYDTALIFLQEALVMLEEDLNDPWAKGDALFYYGWTLYNQGKLIEAEKQLVEALQIVRSLQKHAAAVELKAHLGRIALAQQDVALAEAYAEEIFSFLEANNYTTQGIEHPVVIYLTCYHIYQANQKIDQAMATLKRGERYIRRQLAAITDPALQQSYQENIPEIRDLLQLLASGS